MSWEQEQVALAGIVPVHQERGQLWVDARTLHAALQAGRDFSNWVRGRLDETGALEGEEFIVLDGSPVLANGFNPKPRRDYWLSIDLAKEMAMLERTDVGRDIRRYFIAAEKALRAQQVALPNYAEALRQLADSVEREAAATAQLRVLEPQAQQYQALISADGTYSVADAAKILGTGELRLFALLRERQVLMDKARSGAEHHNMPYQRFIDAGYFRVKTGTRPGSDGDRPTQTTRVTPKGLAWMQRKMAEQQLLLPPLPSPSGAQA